MASYEEDLEYSNKVLRVRTMMEDKSLLMSQHFSTFSLRDNVFEYHMKREYGQDIVIGYHKKGEDASGCNWYTWDTLVVNPNKNLLKIEGLLQEYRIFDEDISEEWHFQQSLVHEPEVLTGMMTVMLLRTVPTEFDYFHLNVHHLDDIIRRYELP